MPLDLSLYPTYPTRTKGLDSSIFKNYTSYVPGNVYPILKQLVVPPTHTPYFVENQFSTMVQPIAGKDIQPIQQLVTTPISTIVHVTTNLPTYVPKSSIHQPPNGGQLGD